MNDEKRTWEEFVEDMISNERKIKHIRGVAISTRWAPYLEEIIPYAKKLRKIFKKSEKKQKS